MELKLANEIRVALRLYKTDVLARYGGAGVKFLVKSLFNPSLRACFLARLCMSSSYVISILARNILIMTHAMDIGRGAIAGSGLYFPHPIGIVIGEGSRIGDNATIYQNVTLGKLRGRYPTLGSGVTIYPNSIVIGGAFIPDGTRIKPGSMIRDDDL